MWSLAAVAMYTLRIGTVRQTQPETDIFVGLLPHTSGGTNTGIHLRRRGLLDPRSAL